MLASGQGALTSDFFVNPLDMGTGSKPVSAAADVFDGRDHKTGAPRSTGTRLDLVFAVVVVVSAELRALSNVYASSDAGGELDDDFVARWTLDWFDLV